MQSAYFTSNHIYEELDAIDQFATSLSRLASTRHLPTVARVIDGNYNHISVNDDSEIYIHSVVRRRTIVAEAMRYEVEGHNRGCRLAASGQAISFPADYNGWFELMSEDGRAAPVIRAVGDLVGLIQGRCLVRQSLTGFVSVDCERRVHVNAGHVLSPVRVVKGTATSSDGITRQRKLLQCVGYDSTPVFLPLDLRGVFSVVTDQHGHGNICQLSTILADYRLPLVVRLVHSNLPNCVDIGSSTGIFRLLRVLNDDCVFVLPLRLAWKSTSTRVLGDNSLIAVPSDVARTLTVVPAARDFYQHWLDSDDGLQLAKRCNQLVTQCRTDVRTLSGDALRHNPATDHHDDVMSWSTGPVSVDVPCRNSSFDSGTASATSYLSAQHEDQLFGEIDDIYSTIRQGRVVTSPQRTTRRSRTRSSNNELEPADNRHTRTRLSSTPYTTQDMNCLVAYRPAPRPLTATRNTNDTSTVATRCHRSRDHRQEHLYSTLDDVQPVVVMTGRKSADSTSGWHRIDQMSVHSWKDDDVIVDAKQDGGRDRYVELESPPPEVSARRRSWAFGLDRVESQSPPPRLPQRPRSVSADVNMTSRVTPVRRPVTPVTPDPRARYATQSSNKVTSSIGSISRSVVDAFRRLKRRSTSEPQVIDLSSLQIDSAINLDADELDDWTQGQAAYVDTTARSRRSWACKTAVVYPERRTNGMFVSRPTPRKSKSPGRRWFGRKKYDVEPDLTSSISVTHYKNVGVF